MVKDSLSVHPSKKGGKAIHFGDKQSVKFKSIASIDLSNNQLGDDCWPALEGILMDAEKRVTDLVLDNNNFTFMPMNLFNCFKKVYIGFSQFFKHK